jgi:putative FmdB family regulatory protein
MPIYEYRCQSCGHELEKLQRMSDAELTDCPECGKSALKKLVSAAAFRLKGAGWYETDFKQTNQRNLVDSGADSGKESSASSESGKDSGKDSSKETGKDSSKESGKASGKESGKESSKESKSSDSAKPAAVDKPAKSSSSAPSANS